MEAAALKTLIAVTLLLVLAGCAQAQNTAIDSSEDRERSHPTHHEQNLHNERTIRQNEKSRPLRVFLTGVITQKDEDRILIEEDPNADCQGNKGPLRPSCGKMYFDITRESDVFREDRNALSLTKVPTDRLRKGQTVSVDYKGNDVAESYPSQTDANFVSILESP